MVWPQRHEDTKVLLLNWSQKCRVRGKTQRFFMEWNGHKGTKARSFFLVVWIQRWSDARKGAEARSYLAVLATKVRRRKVFYGLDTNVEGKFIVNAWLSTKVQNLKGVFVVIYFRS